MYMCNRYVVIYLNLLHSHEDGCGNTIQWQWSDNVTLVLHGKTTFPFFFEAADHKEKQKKQSGMRD